MGISPKTQLNDTLKKPTPRSKLQGMIKFNIEALPFYVTEDAKGKSDANPCSGSLRRVGEPGPVLSNGLRGYAHSQGLPGIVPVHVPAT